LQRYTACHAKQLYLGLMKPAQVGTQQFKNNNTSPAMLTQSALWCYWRVTGRHL